MNRDFSLRVLRFLVSGGSATAVNLGALYCLTEYAHVWYIASSVMAMTLGIIISFTLQKFWTFKNPHMDTVHIQFARYVLLALINLAINTLALYLLVELAHLWYIFAQILTTAALACVNFFVYQLFIFRRD